MSRKNRSKESIITTSIPEKVLGRGMASPSGNTEMPLAKTLTEGVAYVELQHVYDYFKVAKSAAGNMLVSDEHGIIFLGSVELTEKLCESIGGGKVSYLGVPSGSVDELISECCTAAMWVINPENKKSVLDAAIAVLTDEPANNTPNPKLVSSECFEDDGEEEYVRPNAAADLDIDW